MALPLVVPPTAYWDGNDGQWSTFYIKIGTPPVSVRLLPATSQSSVWPVLPGGCTDVAVAGCFKSRGWTFSPNTSTTWDYIGTFDYSLTTEKALGFQGSGYFGNDTVTFGTPTMDIASVPGQVVGGFFTTAFWTGLLGINGHDVYFLTPDKHRPSLLQTLNATSRIPSLSWSYTAGGVYHDPEVFGSLVLGGYDQTRIQGDQNITIPFGSDEISQDLLAPIKSITMGDEPLSSQPFYAFIDSLVPHLWLPLEVCQKFEDALDISWNANYELYTLTDEQHQRLLTQNPSFHFTIATSMEDNASTVDIRLPYAAFDLTGYPPWLDTATRYFPIRRAVDSSQITLGRTFLQEAMVVADYERKQFQIGQALQPGGNVSNIVPIERPATSQASESDKNSHLSGGAIAGIVICVVAVVLFVLLGLFLWYKRYQRHKEEIHEKPANSVGEPKMELPTDPVVDSKRREPSRQLSDQDVQELQSDDVAELESTNIAEMSTPPLAHDETRSMFPKYRSFRRTRSRSSAQELEGTPVDST